MPSSSPQPRSGPPPLEIAPAVALVPVAGQARRMGRPKLLLPFPDAVPPDAPELAHPGLPGTVLGCTLDALLRGGLRGDTSRIRLVTRPGRGDLVHWAEARRVPVTIHHHPERGMLSTLLAGLEALGGAATLAAAGTVLLVTPGDLPRLSPDTVAAVLAALAADRKAGLALPVQRGEGDPSTRPRRGHPLAIAPHLIEAITALDPEVGLRQLRQRFPESVVEVSVDDPGCVDDVDTPAQYRRLLDRPTR